MTTLLPAQASPTTSPATTRSLSGWRELGFLTLLYAAYAVSRVFADDSMAPARERAMRILAIEDTVLLDVERGVVSWFVDHGGAGLLSAYYYAIAHYLITAIMLLWLYRRRASLYPRVR